jgi:hypothetical protein
MCGQNEQVRQFVTPGQTLGARENLATSDHFAVAALRGPRTNSWAQVKFTAKRTLASSLRGDALKDRSVPVMFHFWGDPTITPPAHRS